MAAATSTALADQTSQMAHATDDAYQTAVQFKNTQPGIGVSDVGKFITSLGGENPAAQHATQHVADFMTQYNNAIAGTPPEISAQFVPSSVVSKDENTALPLQNGTGATGSLPRGSTQPGFHSSPAQAVSSDFSAPGGAGPHIASPQSALPGYPGGASGNPPGAGYQSPSDPGTAFAGGGSAAGMGGGLASGTASGGIGGGYAGTGAPGSSGISGAGTGTGGYGPANSAWPAPAGRSQGRATSAGGDVVTSGSGPAGKGYASNKGPSESGTVGGSGRSAIPPQGGHGGSEEKDRQRSAWLAEDEDVWGADVDLPPPVIGG
jgi:hypothetical protein